MRIYFVTAFLNILLVTSVLGQGLSLNMKGVNVVFFKVSLPQNETQIIRTTFHDVMYLTANDTNQAIELITFKQNYKGVISGDGPFTFVDSLSLCQEFDTSYINQVSDTGLNFIYKAPPIFKNSELLYLYKKGFTLERIFHDGTSYFVRQEVLKF